MLHFFSSQNLKNFLSYKLLSVTEHCWRRVNHLKTLLLLTTSSVKTQKLSKLAKLWSRINEWALTSTTFVKKRGKTQNHLPAVLIILGIVIVLRINEEIFFSQNTLSQNQHIVWKSLKISHLNFSILSYYKKIKDASL